MNPTSSVETLPLAPARRMDELCDLFEKACREGQSPRIEDYLDQCPIEARGPLLQELIHLDDYYRREDYRRRFPELDSSSGTKSDGTRTGFGERDRYELVAFHAQGGMGRVSVYHDRQMRRRVAIKELHPDRLASSEILDRFLLEAQITGRLEHPGIVPVYELVRPETGDAPFYTMRFVNGRTLTEATGAYHEKRRSGAAVAVELLTLLNAFVSVCQTIAYAHSQSVIHRDLKGGNVVLGDFGEVIVLDWGLARLINSGDDPGVSPGSLEPEFHEHTLQGVIKGTPAYLSPEAAAGRIDLIGPRTDVYGLGAILYEILAGRAPFRGATVREVLAQVEAADPVPPGEIVPDVPAGLETICLRALAKNPADRPATAGELAGQVQQWLAESADRNRARLERERFFNLSLDLLCTIGADGQFQQLNPAWETTLGWTRDELMARPFGDLIHPDERDATLAEVSAIAGGTIRPAFENRFRHRDGAHRWVSWTASLIPGEQLVYAVGRDVTGRKNAEVALRRSQERFELAVLGSGDGLWDWDRETGESYYSPRWKSMIGYEDHEIAHNLVEWETRLHPADRERVLAVLGACTAGKETAYEVEYRFRHRDGSYRWILDRGVAVRGAEGVTRMAGSHADITGRKQMEQELHESKARHQTALEEMAAELARSRGGPGESDSGSGIR